LKSSFRRRGPSSEVRGRQRRFLVLNANKIPATAIIAATAARIKYVVGKAGTWDEMLEVVVLELAEVVVLSELEEAVLLVDVVVTVELDELVALEVDGPEEVEVVVLTVETLDEIEVLVTAEGMKVAVNVSGPRTVAAVVADPGAPRVVLPVLEAQPEKAKPALALADTVAVEEASNQSEPAGAVVPAPGGETVNVTGYWSA